MNDKDNYTDYTTNTNTKQRNVPPNVPMAPYPPFISTSSVASAGTSSSARTVISGNLAATSTRSLSSQLATNFGVTTISNGKHTESTNNKNSKAPSVASTTLNTSNATKRQHPARIEFYNNDYLYGAVNCLGHANHHINKRDSTQATLLRSGSSGGTTGTNTNRNNNNAGSSSSINSLSSRINKLGPVLLELRCLYPNVNHYHDDNYSDDDGDNNDDKNVKNEEKEQQPEEEGGDGASKGTSNSKSTFSYYQSRTIAVSRGIASSSFTTSTCLSFRNHNNNQYNNNNNTSHIYCATGLSSGALAIHTFKNVDKYVKTYIEEQNNERINSNTHDGEQCEEKRNCQILDSSKSDDAKVIYLSNYQTRLHRAASAVAWKNSGSYSNFVAIGYSSSSGEKSEHRGNTTAGQQQQQYQRSTNPIQSSGNPGGFAFVWDVEAQSTVSKGVKQTPLHKLAHNSSVASLSWIPDGQTLAIGCQHRNLQIHDLGMSGTSAMSVYAHDNSVNGIEVDPFKTNVFATFSRGLAEPVKLWDVRKMDSCLAEIKTHTSHISSSRRIGKELPSFVSAIAWDSSSEGILSIATGGDLKFYNTRLNSSRPVLSHLAHSNGLLQCMKFLPTLTKKKNHTLIPQRLLAVSTDGAIADLPTHQVAPIAISNRDGRVVSVLGSYLCSSSTVEGPSAMEKLVYDPSEDISATMMRRARCLHTKRYSTDAASNLEMLSLEQDDFLCAQEESTKIKVSGPHLTSLEHLQLVWSWIERVESLCFRNNIVSTVDERFWPVKNLCDAGILHLLRLNVANVDDVTTFDSFSKSEVFNRNVYDSSLRRAALTACGWDGKRDKDNDIHVNTESYGHFERSAALACWHGDLGETVAALQKGADYVRSKISQDSDSKRSGFLTTQYAETLELVAMCVAGYTSNGEKTSPSTQVWTNACKNLLNRPNLNAKSGNVLHSNYLRAICSFLIDDSDLDKTLSDESLNLYDRVAFACIYLPRKQLKSYLESCVEDCLRNGKLEGLLITGINKQGISLLQSYVDSTSDIQTAALISSRVILPADWTRERIVSSEWLSSYREFLNKNQMWQSRAMFDVGRVELLRNLRDRQQADEQLAQNNQSMNQRMPVRRSASQIRRQMQTSSLLGRNHDNPIPSFPPQIHARCNYCNTSLPLAKLRRQENIANNWLSRQKPVLQCCPNPTCRKPLPRCSICLLPLGCLNPYMELRREGNRLSRGAHGHARGGEDLSALANMPFGEWFTWCGHCHHGGHAHHYLSWFDSHDYCPVSGCDCRCKFDVINKLRRPAFRISRSSKTD